MSASKGKGPIFDPGICRCCGNLKKCRILNVEYECMGQKEVYSDMIMDCFGLLMSHLDASPSERLICATCVIRIRDAINFRKQVFKCEETFLQMKIHDANNAPGTVVLNSLAENSDKALVVEVVVKTEPAPLDEQSDAGEAFADAPGADADADEELKPNMKENSNDDIALESNLRDKRAIATTSMKRGAAILAKQMMMTRRSLAKRLRRKAKWRADSMQRFATGIYMSRDSSLKSGTKELQMSKLQQIMREKDPSYMKEINILTIIEYSYACPFKCRHNHLLCYYCGEFFQDPLLLREHTISSHNPRKFKVTEHRNMLKVDLTRIDCRLCGTKIDNLDDFRSHITSVHNRKYYFNIKDSMLPFKLSKSELKCAICELIFPYFHALNKHMNEHFSNYVCETCGLGFVDHARLMMHQQRHEEGEFPCGTCGKMFKAQYNRDLHVDRVHRKKGRVYCPKCDVKLMSYPQKLKHLVEVHGEEPLSFPCDSCEKVFDSRRILTIHKRKDHLKDYRYICQCGQKFFTRFALNNHMPTHTGERNFKCKVCEKSYPRLKTLKDHMRIHTNDRRYRCHVCGQAFIQNCSLKGHMKSQHPEYG